MRIRTAFGIKQFIHFSAVTFCIIWAGMSNIILLGLASQSGSSAISFLCGFISAIVCLIFIIIIVMIKDYYDSEEKRNG